MYAIQSVSPFNYSPAFMQGSLSFLPRGTILPQTTLSIPLHRDPFSIL